MRTISEDVALSGWYFPSFDRSDYTTTDPAVDRQLLYYPYIIQQRSDNSGSLDAGLPVSPLQTGDSTLDTSLALTHAIRSPEMVVTMRAVFRRLPKRPRSRRSPCTGCRWPRP